MVSMTTDPKIAELENLITHAIEDIRLGPASLHLNAYISRIRRELGKAYLLIPRSELPAATIVDRNGYQRVEVEGSDAGTWPVNGNAARNRQWGLEYLAAAEALEKYQAEAKTVEAEDAKRLDEEADALRRALYGDNASDPISFEQMAPETRDKYRRAARKARELHDTKAKAN